MDFFLRANLKLHSWLTRNFICWPMEKIVSSSSGNAAFQGGLGVEEGTRFGGCSAAFQAAGRLPAASSWAA
jgi:hypothetical protein